MSIEGAATRGDSAKQKEHHCRAQKTKVRAGSGQTVMKIMARISEVEKTTLTTEEKKRLMKPKVISSKGSIKIDRKMQINIK